MALRRAVASMRRPRSTSVKSCRAALTIAEATTAVARIENGAALAPPAKDSVMGDFSGEREWAEPRGALLNSAATQTLPGPALPLESSPIKMGTGAARRPPSRCNKRRTTGAVLRHDAIRRHQVVAADLRRLRPPAPHHRKGTQATAQLPPPVRPALMQGRPGAAAPVANRS